MNSKDLRIGNLVRVRNGRIVEVDITYLKHLALWEIEKYTPDPPIEPIPLTGELLIKLGFKKFNNKYHIGFNWGAYSVYEVGDIYDHWYFFHEFDKTKRITSSIKYLHQLQNIYFALTGAEFEFKK